MVRNYNFEIIYSYLTFELVILILTQLMIWIWLHAQETNSWGAVYTTSFALEHVRNSKGKILVTSSAEAWLPTPRTAVYSGSKTALVNFHETLREETRPQIGITIATPGYTQSEINDQRQVLIVRWQRGSKPRIERCRQPNQLILSQHLNLDI